ncbi:hypothetical protein HGM15179_004067 [Zosterops borbonicus]|uniref:Uncharacterized protein n=1 Tax=Zosterops borbonicus TaxID=364589 RepID=A0A8K1LRF9_9PASS|nr:hypothetical protein HGM15179_004067 [Zosterops borbonicus]
MALGRAVPCHGHHRSGLPLKGSGLTLSVTNTLSAARRDPGPVPVTFPLRIDEEKDMVDPSPPGVPKDLSWDNFITGPGAFISAVICWDLPSKRDLRIHHYKICISLWGPEQLIKITEK